ncbi:LysR substrate-binding domain-containing protein [Streptomyces halstedii]|uniref:LysR substrate-binding domain-containing protein n=1 Tax=Streptomyces halstedii TaxID=1944 RepID=UPI003822E31A
MNFTDPFGPLRDGTVEIASAWLPVREPDLTVGPVIDAEPLLLMVAIDHPLALKGEVGMEDLADWVLPYCGPPTPDYWLQTLVPTHTPGGRPIRRGPEVTTFQEVAAAVAAGDAVSLVHGDAARYYRWPGLRYLHPHDAPTGEWALIWPAAQETDTVRALARAAKGCPVIPGGRTTTATAPRRVVGTPEYIQYADVPPPCDVPPQPERRGRCPHHLTPRADPPRITGQPLASLHGRGFRQ